MSARSPRGLLRRLEAAALAAGVLWMAGVTAGSDTAAAAFQSLRDASSLGVLRWELGDLWTADTLSPAAVLTIGESPLLLSARQEVARLWSDQRGETPAETGTDSDVVVPVEETPLEAPNAPDNGVAARTLVPTDPSGYTVCGRVYISNSTDYALSVSALTEQFDAELTGEGPRF